MISGEWMSGGVIYIDDIKANDDNGGYSQEKREAKLIDIQIKNDLESLFR